MADRGLRGTDTVSGEESNYYQNPNRDDRPLTDPVAAGLIASLRKAGRQCYRGDSSSARARITKRLEILKDVIPQTSHELGFGAARRRGVPLGDLQLGDIRPAAQALKLKLEEDRG